MHPAIRPRSATLIVVVMVLLLTAACSGGDDSADTDTAVDDSAQPTTATDGGGAGLANDSAAEAEGEVGVGGDDAAPAADADDPTGATTDGDAAVAPPTTAATGERIIKEGTITIEVAPGEYDVAFGQVVARAQELGGHVAGTSSSTSPGADPDEVLTSGQVTIRIPVRAFEDLITSIGDAGEIIDRNITSQDVTAEYTDLESRRRNLQAQERFYLGLLEQSQTVQDAIAVQQQLEEIQGQIEQITGRLNLLGDRSAFSTLTVRIAERGSTPVEAEGTEPAGLAPYIEQALDTLIATVGSLIIFLTFLVPFLVLAALGYAVWRTVRRRRPGRPAPQPLHPPQPPQHLRPEPAPVGADVTAADDPDAR